jgi:hypothetical protein
VPKVFISYASEDSETAEYLYLELTKRGVDIWKDNKSLRSGDYFTNEIDKAIEASDLAIVCLSSVSVNKTGFVQKEFRKIIQMQGYRPEGVPFALPVKLDNCQPPQGFSEIHWRQMPTTNREAFIDTFVADIDEQLMKVAQRKASFDRKSTLSKLSSFFEMRNDVLCRLADYPEPIVIKAALQMMLVNAESYRKAGSPDLSFWSRETLDVTLRRILFSQRYSDLVLGFEPLEFDIKRNLAAEAEKIGYSIQQLIVAPDMAAMRWLEPFEIKVEEQFETRTPKVSVNIRIHVTTSVRGLSHIEQFLYNRLFGYVQFGQVVSDERHCRLQF